MFKLEKNPTFTHVVKVQTPVDGGYETQDFKATFKLLAAEEMARFNTTTPVGMANFLREVVTDLTDIVGEDGEVLPYSHALRDQVIGSVPALNALFNTYVTACSKARVGN